LEGVPFQPRNWLDKEKEIDPQHPPAEPLNFLLAWILRLATDADGKSEPKILCQMVVNGGVLLWYNPQKTSPKNIKMLILQLKSL